MNDPNSQLPPPVPPTAPAAAPPPAKKGLPALAWVAIGCGVLLVIALLVVLVGGMFVAKKVGDFAESAGENPALAAAEMVVRMNPELELVETDREAGTLKVREKKTGEVYVFDAAEINEGKFSFGKEGEEATVTFGGEGEQAQVTIEGPEGETFQAGTASAEDLPDWVPVIPGGRSEGGFSSRTGEGFTGNVVLSVDKPFEEVMEYYEQALADAGFEVEKSTYNVAGQRGGSLNGTREDEKRTLNVGFSEADGKTQVMLSFTDMGG